VTSTGGNGVAEGAELARGYISLSVKYGSAMSQVDKDLADTKQKAGVAGEAAGMRFSDKFGAAVHPARTFRNYSQKILDEAGGDIDKAGAIMGQRFTNGLLRSTDRMSAVGNKIGRGLSGGVEAALTGVGAIGTAGVAGFEKMETKAKETTSAMSGGIMGLVSGPMLALGAAVTTIAGAFEVLKGGMERLETLQHTREQLEAMGYSGQQVNAVFKDMQESVKGTQFGMEEMAGVMKGALLQGIKPGQDMVNYLKEIQNAAALTGAPVEAVAGMMDRLRTRGTATMREMMSFTRQGLPIATWIKKDLNLTQEQFQDFVKHHGVTYQLFMDELAKHTHDGAERMSESLGAQTHKMGENLKAIGSDLVAPFFGSIPKGLQAINAKLEQFDAFLQAHAKQISSFVHGVFGPIGGLISGVVSGVGSFAKGTVAGVKDSHENMASGMGTAVSSFVNAIKTAGTWLKTHSDQIRSYGEAFGHAIGNVQHAFLNVEHAGSNIMHAFSNVEHAALNVNHAFLNGGHAVRNVVHAFGNIGHAIGNVMHAFGNIGHAFGNIFHALGFDILAGLIGTTLKAAFDLGLTTVTAVWHVLEGLWHAAEGLWHIVTELWHSFTDAISGPLKSVGSAFHDVGDFIQKDVKPALADAGHFLRDLANEGIKVIEFFEHLPQKIIAGIGNLGKDIGDAIKGALSHIHLPHIPGFADGGYNLPQQATIASARPGGLVQWAEPSTGGEAFIPLHPAKRARSLKLWHQTGKLLGVEGHEGMYSDKKWSGVPSHGMKFDDGGFRGAGGLSSAEAILSQLTGGTGGNRAQYQMGGFGPSGIDCSGLVSAVVNAYLGMSPLSSRMNTTNEADWLGKRGFKTGTGPSGSLRVAWYDHGGGGAGHTALTLPNGLNAESTTSNGISGARVGSKAAGADASEFDHHMYLDVSGGKTGSWFAGGGWATPSSGGGGGGLFSGSGGGDSGGGGGGDDGPDSSGIVGDGTDYSSDPANAGDTSGGSSGGVDIGGGSGSGVGAGSSPGISAPSGAPSGGDSKQQAAAAIIAEGKRRGYTDEQIQWVLADSIGESGLSTTAANGDHKGLFQQDASYKNRDTLQGQVSGFYDRLDKTSSDMSIGDRISKTPAQGGVEGGGYGPDWISQHLGDAKTYMAGVGDGLSAGDGGEGMGVGGGRGGHKIRELNDKIADLTTKIKETQDKIDHPTGKKPRTQQQTDVLNDRLAKLNRELGEAKSDLGEAQAGGGGRGGKGGLAGLFGAQGGDDSLKSLADIGTNGIMQSFLPEGFINPFGTTAMHAGSVIFSFLGALMSGKGSNMAGALMSGRGSNMVGAGAGNYAVNSQGQLVPRGEMPSAAGGGGGMGGGGPMIDASQHFEGASFGHSNEAIAPVIQHAKTATLRSTGTIDSSRVYGT
jgi:hypothetical protein